VRMKLILKITLLSILIFSNMFFITGCWNYREIEDLAIVAGAAIDKEDDKYVLTAEIANVKGGRDAKPESKIVSGKGDTIFDAIRNTIKISGKPLYWSHTDIFIISKEIAREGVVQAIDLLTRDPEIRMSANLLISNEKTAKALLEPKSTTTVIHSTEINRMLISQKLLSKAPVTTIYEFVDALADKERSVVLPVIGIGSNLGENATELSGTAVFKKDRMVGFLDGEDTKYFLFVINKVRGGLLIQKEKVKDSQVNVALEIYEDKTKTNIKPVYSNGKLTVNLDVYVNTAAAEIGGMVNYINEPGRSKLKRDTEESLKHNIERVIKKVQNDYDSDIFQFGRIIKDQMPDVWRAMEKDWEKIYKDLDVNVNTHIKIKNSSLLLKPIGTGG
jgi:spore germination protein KC